MEPPKQVKQGHYDNAGNAFINLHLCGVKHDAPGVEFSGILDTGFSGFLQIPLVNAFSLGLPLEGAISVTLADGSSLSMLTALVQTTLEGVTQVGTVLLSSGSDDILIGMDFLRSFNQALVVSKNLGVLLIDDYFELKFSDS